MDALERMSAAQRLLTYEERKTPSIFWHRQKRVIEWLFQTTERFLARWLVENNRWEHRPWVKKMMVARRAVSLSRVRDLPRNFNKKVIVKKQVGNNFHSLHYYWPQKSHQNVENFAVKPLQCDEHFEVISMVDKTKVHGKLLSIC